MRDGKAEEREKRQRDGVGEGNGELWGVDIDRV